MKHIDNSTLIIEAAWQTTATQKMGALKALTHDQTSFMAAKAKLFRAGHWRAIKNGLSALSKNKCWYCESSLARQHGDVDHFRPKGAVEDEPTHSGYWWLALEPSNFRLSCISCNQATTQAGQTRGKLDKFPLLNGGTRAFMATDDINLERPILLDPTNAEDVKLIAFDLDGLPRPFFEKSTDEEKYLRASTSIEVFALARSDICRLRSKVLKNIDKALKAIITLEASLGLLAEEIRNRFELQLNELKATIKESIDPHAEFLAASVDILQNRRGHSPWLDDLLRQHGYWN